VFLAEATNDENFKVAIKAISKKKIGDNLKQIKAEINILSSLDHPNIVKYYETYENKEFLYIVMEYCPGGDLFKFITK
jgi:calcium-dependent protein kinase